MTALKRAFRRVALQRRHRHGPPDSRSARRRQQKQTVQREHHLDLPVQHPRGKLLSVMEFKINLRGGGSWWDELVSDVRSFDYNLEIQRNYKTSLNDDSHLSKLIQNTQIRNLDFADFT